MAGGVTTPTKLPSLSQKTQTDQNDTPSIGSIKVIFSYYQRRNPIQHPRNDFNIHLKAHADIYNLFNLGRHLVSVETYRHFRSRSFASWKNAAMV